MKLTNLDSIIENIDCDNCACKAFDDTNICNAAYDFYNAAHYLNNSKEICYPNISARNIVAIAMNISFSCELFLKGILKVISGKVTKGHNLEKLFGQLDDKIKNNIINIVSFDYECETGMSITQTQFFESLRIVKDWFVEQRYWFEKDYGFDYKGIGFIKKICDAIMLIVNSLFDEELWFKVYVSSEDKQSSMMKLINI